MGMLISIHLWGEGVDSPMVVQVVEDVFDFL